MDCRPIPRSNPCAPVLMPSKNCITAVNGSTWAVRRITLGSLVNRWGR